MYYVEYEYNTKDDKRALVVDGDKKMSFDSDGRKVRGMLGFVPFAGLFTKGSAKLKPEVLYDSGYYYQFVESGTATVKNVEVAFDRYVKRIKSISNADIELTTYLVYYNADGDIDKILSMTAAPDEDAMVLMSEEESKKDEQRSYEMNSIVIKKLTRELPPEIMSFPKGCKVYGPGLGDMNELIEQPPLLEEY